MLYTPSGDPIPYRISEGDLEDALRDFVKSESQGLLDLREMQVTSDCVDRALNRFSIFAMVTTALSGIGAVFAILIKGNAFEMDIAWPHFVGLAVVGISCALALCFLFQIIRVLRRTDRLVSKYADL